MTPRELADRIHEFCTEQLGVLTLEMEANETDTIGIMAEAGRVSGLLAEVVESGTGVVDIGLANDAIEVNRRMVEQGQARAVFAAVNAFMQDLHKFMYEKAVEWETVDPAPGLGSKWPPQGQADPVRIVPQCEPGLGR